MTVPMLRAAAAARAMMAARVAVHQLPALRVGKNYRIRESDVDAYLADRSVQVEGA